MFRSFIMAGIAALILGGPSVASAQDVEISAPVLDSGTMQQTARVDAGINGICWYWIHADSSGTTCYKATDHDQMPTLNPSNSSWHEIDWDVWYDDLCEWGRYGGPSTLEEAAYLTDTLTYAIHVGGSENFDNAYYYLGWSWSLEQVSAESVLYSE